MLHRLPEDIRLCAQRIDDESTQGLRCSFQPSTGATYMGTRAKVITPNGSSEEFNFLQAATLAPFLFIIVLDYALRQAIRGQEQKLGFILTPRRSPRHPAETLTDLDMPTISVCYLMK